MPNESQGTPTQRRMARRSSPFPLTTQKRNAASFIANAERVLINERRSYDPRCPLGTDASAQETKAAAARAEPSAYKNVRYRANLFCLPSASVMRLTT